MPQIQDQTQEPKATLRSVDHIVDPQYLPDASQAPVSQLAEHWRVVLRYRWSILAIALVAAATGVLSAMSAVPLYRAEARILVKFNQPNVSNLQQFEGTPLHWLYFETQADIIKSRAIAERVVDRLDGAAERERSPAPARDAGAGPRARISALLPDWRRWIPAEWRKPEPPPPTPESIRAGRVNAIMGGLTVTGGKESEVLVVGYVSASPEQAARVVNETAAAYIDFGLESRASNVQRTTVWLGDRIEELRDKLALSEASLREFQAREGMVDTRNRESIISSKLGTLSAELIRAQSRRSETETRYRQVRELVKTGADRETLSSVLESALVLEAHRAKRDAERRVAELGERYGEKHPKMISAQADLSAAERRFQLEIEKAAGSARKEFELAAAQERELKRIIEAQHAEMRRLSGKAFELSKLEREVEANRNLYETYIARFKEADIAEDYDVPQARVIDPAAVPAYPFKPDKRRMVLVAVFLGLAAGIGLAFLRSHLDHTFVTREQVEEVLRLPVLGQLPKLRGRAGGARSPDRACLDTPRAPFAERINDVRTAIAFSDVDQPPDAVLITSAVPGEGKTTLAVNLATAFRQRGRTLLIDGDLRKGRVGEVFELGSHVGLSDVLTGACTLEEALVEIHDAPGLTVLGTGTLPPNPLEVLSSMRFERTLRELREAFDYVVIDGSPLLPVSDSIVLGRHVPCVVLAVQADRTPHDAAREAVKRLQSARIKPTGVVLQKVDLARSRSYSRRYANAYNRYYEYSPQSGRG